MTAEEAMIATPGSLRGQGLISNHQAIDDGPGVTCLLDSIFFGVYRSAPLWEFPFRIGPYQRLNGCQKE